MHGAIQCIEDNTCIHRITSICKQISNSPYKLFALFFSIAMYAALNLVAYKYIASSQMLTVSCNTSVLER